jgi:hypothetical protein
MEGMISTPESGSAGVLFKTVGGSGDHALHAGVPTPSRPFATRYFTGSGMQLSDDELHALYAWVDELPLSRPKRNIARDFSDGGNGALQLVASCICC